MDENEVLARALLTASEDPVTGTEQTNKDFFKTARLRFIELGPSDNVTTEGRYGNRTTSSIKQHFIDMSADVQKFRVSLSKIVASKPTGVVKEESACLSIALHTVKTKVMEYEYKDYDKRNWIHLKAWRVLRNHPKWAPVSTAVESRSEAVN